MKDDTKNTENINNPQNHNPQNYIDPKDFTIVTKKKKSIKDKAKETLIECTKILDNRGDQYGDSKINFDSLAEIFSATLNRNKKRILVDGNIEIRGSDVAFFMVEFKRLRIENSIDPEKDDSAKDAMAYLALGNELKKDEAKLDKRNTN